MGQISVIDGTLQSISYNGLWNSGMKALVMVINAQG